MTVDSALEQMAQEGFLLPSESLPAVPNAAYLVIAQCSSWRHSHCQPTHMSRTGHARLRPFLPLLIYRVLSLPRRPDPQSSRLPISVAHLYQELMVSSFSLLCSLSGLSCLGRGRAHVLLFGKSGSKQEQQWF